MDDPAHSTTEIRDSEIGMVFTSSVEMHTPTFNFGPTVPPLRELLERREAWAAVNRNAKFWIAVILLVALSWTLTLARVIVAPIYTGDNHIGLLIDLAMLVAFPVAAWKSLPPPWRKRYRDARAMRHQARRELNALEAQIAFQLALAKVRANRR